MTTPHFNGSTYEPDKDWERLTHAGTQERSR